MSKWYKNNKFLGFIEQFQRLEQMGLGNPEISAYSVDYALWKMLQKGQLDGFKFERQKRILGNVVSFYCKDANLVVDLKNVDHPIRKKEEQECDRILEKAGIKILRFHRDEILERPNSVKNSILEELYVQTTSPKAE